MHVRKIEFVGKIILLTQTKKEGGNIVRIVYPKDLEEIYNSLKVYVNRIDFWIAKVQVDPSCLAYLCQSGLAWYFVKTDDDYILAMSLQPAFLPRKEDLPKLLTGLPPDELGYYGTIK